MGRYFGDKFSVECGHCNYCASKSSIEVRQLPVIGSKPAYDRYKQAFGMAKAGKSKTEEADVIIEEECKCITLGLKWSYKPYPSL